MPLADPGEQLLADRTYRSLHAATALGQLDRDLAAGAAETVSRAQSVRKETGFLAWALSAGRAPDIATAATEAPLPGGRRPQLGGRGLEVHDAPLAHPPRTRARARVRPLAS